MKSYSLCKTLNSYRLLPFLYILSRSLNCTLSTQLYLNTLTSILVTIRGCCLPLWVHELDFESNSIPQTTKMLHTQLSVCMWWEMVFVHCHGRSLLQCSGLIATGLRRFRFFQMQFKSCDRVQVQWGKCIRQTCMCKEAEFLKLYS